MDSVLGKRSWGVKYDPKTMIRKDNYYLCPYESCNRSDNQGFLYQIVGYDKGQNLIIIECPTCNRLSVVHNKIDTLGTVESMLIRSLSTPEKEKKKMFIPWFELIMIKRLKINPEDFSKKRKPEIRGKKRNKGTYTKARNRKNSKDVARY